MLPVSGDRVVYFRPVVVKELEEAVGLEGLLSGEHGTVETVDECGFAHVLWDGGKRTLVFAGGECICVLPKQEKGVPQNDAA